MLDPAVRALARLVPPDARQPFGAYIFRADEPGADLGRHLEQAVFLEAFGNTPDLLAKEYGRYETDSLFICVIDHLRGVPAGVMRVICPSRPGSRASTTSEPVWGEPAEAHARAHRHGARPSAHLGHRHASPSPTAYRGRRLQGLVSMGLYQTLTLAAFRCGIEWFVAILDMPVFRLMRWKLRMIFAGYDGVAPGPTWGRRPACPRGATCRGPSVGWPRRTRTCTRSSSSARAGAGMRPIDLAAAADCFVRSRAAAAWPRDGVSALTQAAGAGRQRRHHLGQPVRRLPGVSTGSPAPRRSRARAGASPEPASRRPRPPW